jgi:hypothetical protein
VEVNLRCSPSLSRRGHSAVEEPGRRIVKEELNGEGSALPWVEEWGNPILPRLLTPRSEVQRFRTKDEATFLGQGLTLMLPCHLDGARSRDANVLRAVPVAGNCALIEKWETRAAVARLRRRRLCHSRAGVAPLLSRPYCSGSSSRPDPGRPDVLWASAEA